MFGFYTGLYPKYGDDAFGAATVSRQPPRPNKPVEAPGQLIWTRVQFPPPPLLSAHIKILKKRTCDLRRRLF